MANVTPLAIIGWPKKSQASFVVHGPEDLAFLSCLAGGLACEQLGAGSININKFITSVNDIS